MNCVVHHNWRKCARGKHTHTHARTANTHPKALSHARSECRKNRVIKIFKWKQYIYEMISTWWAQACAMHHPLSQAINAVEDEGVDGDDHVDGKNGAERSDDDKSVHASVIELSLGFYDRENFRLTYVQLRAILLSFPLAVSVSISFPLALVWCSRTCRTCSKHVCVCAVGEKWTFLASGRRHIFGGICHGSHLSGLRPILTESRVCVFLASRRFVKRSRLGGVRTQRKTRLRRSAKPTLIKCKFLASN